jgi:condensation domain-containing protein/phosphopantetheine binding protein
MADHQRSGAVPLNISVAWCVRGQLDLVALHEALGMVIARYDVLRTRFIEHGGTVQQVVGPTWVPAVHWEDLSGLPGNERETLLLSHLRQFASNRFTPASGQLLFVAVLGLGPGEQVLFLSVHRFVFDQASIRIFLEALQRCYAEACSLKFIRASNRGSNPDRTSAGGHLNECEEGKGADSADIAPQGEPTVQLLAHMWAELLEIPTPRPEDSFFELGGHSLMATRFLARLADRIGHELPLRTLFEHPELQDFAEIVDQEFARERFETGEQSNLIASDLLPVSAFQERVWLAEQIAPGAASYNLPLAWRIHGRLDERLLSRALSMVVERHEILRTRFIEQDGRLYQRIDQPWCVGVEREDLSALPVSEQQDLLAGRLLKAAKTPFDVSSGWLLKVALVDLSGGEQAIYICLHHLVADAASLSTLLAEIARSYAWVSGDIAELRPARQYRDFVQAQSAELRTEHAAKRLADRVAQLTGSPPYLVLEPPSNPEPNGAVPIILPGDLLRRFASLQTERGVSWFMLVATALSAALHLWTGQHDITFGCPIANIGEEADDIIGPRMNLVVMRSRCSSASTLGNLLGEMRKNLLNALEYAFVPFETVVERLAPARDPSRTPYADVVLNVNVMPESWPKIGGCEITLADFQPIWEQETKFGVTVSILKKNGCLDGVMSYRGDRFSRNEVERLARLLEWMLDNFVESFDQPIWTMRSALPERAHFDGSTSRSAAHCQYMELIRIQMLKKESESFSRGLEYWIKQLQGAPGYLPFVLPPHAEQDGTVEISFERDILQLPRGIHETHQASSFMAAAVAALLHCWTGEDDITFGFSITNRDNPALEDVIGPCMNTVVLRSRCEAETTAADLLEAMQCTILSAFEHKNIPLQAVLARLNPPRKPGSTPYVDVAIVMDTASPARASLGDCQLTPFAFAQSGAELAEHGLIIHFITAEERIHGFVRYRGDRFTGAQARQIAHLLSSLLPRFAERPYEPFRTTAVPDENEREHYRLGADVLL